MTCRKRGTTHDRFRNEDGHSNFWQLERDGVSQSFVSSFLTCRVQTYLRYVEGLVSRRVPFYFAYGTCVHWLLERLYRKRQPPKHPKRWVKSRIKAYEQQWLQEVPTPTDYQLTDQEKVYLLAEAQMPSYIERWIGDFPKHKYPIETTTARPSKWLELEQRFNVIFRYPDGLKVPLCGTRDGLFETREAETYILDHKCRSVIVDQDILETMHLDFQLMFYLWATWKQRGHCPDGAVLNIIRRPGQRMRVDEPLTDFAARVCKDIENPKRWDHYFIRYRLVLSGSSEVRDWERTRLIPIMREIRAWWEGRAGHYTSDQHLLTKYGRSDMFHPIVYDDRSDCFIREKPMDYQTTLA